MTLLMSKMIWKTRWESVCLSTVTASNECSTKLLKITTQEFTILIGSKLMSTLKSWSMSSSRLNMESIWRTAMRTYWRWGLYLGWTWVTYRCRTINQSQRLSKSLSSLKTRCLPACTFLITVCAVVLKSESPYAGSLRWSLWRIINCKLRTLRTRSIRPLSCWDPTEGKSLWWKL